MLTPGEGGWNGYRKGGGMTPLLKPFHAVGAPLLSLQAVASRAAAVEVAT